MTITAAIVLFVSIWAVVFFIVLPFGVVTQQEDGDIVPGVVHDVPATPPHGEDAAKCYQQGRHNGQHQTDRRPAYPLEVRQRPDEGSEQNDQQHRRGDQADGGECGGGLDPRAGGSLQHATGGGAEQHAAQQAQQVGEHVDALTPCPSVWARSAT